jgi:hypothetical protein
MNTLEELKELRGNFVAGATHLYQCGIHENSYIKLSHLMPQEWDDKLLEWQRMENLDLADNIRSLADIDAQIQLKIIIINQQETIDSYTELVLDTVRKLKEIDRSKL